MELDLIAVQAIPEQTKNEAVQILDNLIMKNIITGYSWYDKNPASDRVVTFAHSHEESEYKRRMIASLMRSLCAPRSYFDDKFRDKGSAYRWELEFKFRDEKGKLQPCKRVKDTRTGLYVNLSKYESPLKRNPECQDLEGHLVGENPCEWEINLPFNRKKILLRLANLFARKSGERGEKDTWPNPYNVPIIIIGKRAIACAEELKKDYVQAIRFYLATENKHTYGEISFVIQEKLSYLRSSSGCVGLQKLGFELEQCLVNKSFADYLNKER